jgi:predicted nucleic-acid-binding protein
MKPLRTNLEFVFTLEENEKIESVAYEMIELIKNKSLTYIEAKEVIEVCKAKLKMLRVN